ncbi:hypothetical protein S-CBP4_0029 [Synechococcus phage S-CBP4]|uniref:Uncharacterized protein n=1 Tax=Synechococcus phage S-CBP4 TaxID=754059 RepID=A0A096VKQ3_9CAUD|nr:hypothetical protein S-CBP4_0029 [Synechococcus phage S-CBP4]AGK86636.1 hypothetical protein S-CBP4_0029 [Synechococcus phage S-CBP4]
MSIVPGTSVILVENNAIGSLTNSQTQNPPTPVEYGRTVASGQGIRLDKVKLMT